MNEIIGKPIDRVDGRLKVTGGARYAAEFQLPNMAYAYLVQSTIAKGRIRSMDVSKAVAVSGVLAVLTHENAPRLKTPLEDKSFESKLGEKDLLPLQRDQIYYDGQHIAVIVADTFERARDAASLIKVEYDPENAVFQMEEALSQAYEAKESFGRKAQSRRGDPDAGFATAPIKCEETYITPIEHHNAMEPHATIANWNGDELTVYDATQWVLGTRKSIADLLGISGENVRVISPFVGGGFGSKGFMWAHPVIAAMAAKTVGRPVKLVLTRQQMFSATGHRPRTIQKVGLGATREGKFTVVSHRTTTQTSMVEEFLEPSGMSTRVLYDSPAMEVKHLLVRLNTGTPCPMRAPGEASGTFAVESALDELSYKLKIDPIQLRLLNYADKNPQTNQPWSGKNLKQCYERGAATMNWAQRNPEPRSMREGRFLVGYGMATATYPGNRSAASAKVQIFRNGSVIASSCTQDIGTGTYTIMTQIVSEALGIPVARIEFKLGDSKLPKAPVSGGSQTAASVGPAVQAAALSARSKVVKLAIADKDSPLQGRKEYEITSQNDRLFLTDDTSKGETYAAILGRSQVPFIEAECQTRVSTREKSGDENTGTKKNEVAAKEGGGSCFAAMGDENVDREQYSFHSFGAQFAKVQVDPLLGMVRVVKWVSVMDIGRVLNLKTARNQVCGGVIMGLGMALMEETVLDPNRGRIVTRDLANYHVPVHADIPDIDVQFIDNPDPFINPFGGRGVGEIGITGAPAAIANAVYHATEIRIRELPITPDKLISA